MSYQNLIRLVAFLALTGSLVDAARLLGVGSGDASPLEMFGVIGFSILGVFSIARMFAGVGIWIRSTWGTPLLLGTTLIELFVFLIGIVPLDIGIIGFGFRLAQLAGAILILWTTYRIRQQRIHD